MVRRILPWLVVLIGVCLLALGIALYIEANLGVDPWSILTLGLARTLCLSAGTASQVSAVLTVSVAWLVFGRSPRICTILIPLLMGPLLNGALDLLPGAGTVLAGFGYLAAAIPAIGIGTGLYIAAGRGEGPIDMLMMAASQRFRRKPGRVRIAMDIAVAVVGVALGGPYGIGTLAGVIGIGPMVQITLNALGASQKGGRLMTPFDLELARQIDHTLLKPEASTRDVEKLCDEALQYQFHSVCINPAFVPLARQRLIGSDVKICTVIGFPLGASSTFVKAAETRDAVAFGADEIDMVIHVGALKSGNPDSVRRDIEAVVEAAAGRLVKVIIETALLSDEEKVTACRLATAAGAQFVKTSTGFGPGGATADDVRLMRNTVGPNLGVKASGGIRTRETALQMIEAGANRLGVSAGIAIVSGQNAGEGKY